MRPPFGFAVRQKRDDSNPPHPALEFCVSVEWALIRAGLAFLTSVLIARLGWERSQLNLVGPTGLVLGM